MTDPYGRTPKGMLERIIQRVGALETRLTRIIPPRLGASSNIPILTDLNAALEAGWFRAVSAINGPTTTANGHVLVFRAGSTALLIRQEFRRIFADGSGIQDTRRWVRTSSDGGVTWTAWVLVDPGTDPTWTALTALNGWTGVNTFGYRVRGDMAFLSGEIYGGANQTVAFTLPADARPVQRLAPTVARFATTSTPALGTLAINTNGDCTFNLLSGTIPTASPGIALRGISYPLN